MAYLMGKGPSGDLAVRFNSRGKLMDEVNDLVKQSEEDGCYVLVTVTAVPEGDYEQEYKKFYRRKTIKDKGLDVRKELSILKAILGWN